MLLFINFKAYRESTGNNAVGIIRGIEKEFGSNPSIILVLNPLDSMIETKLTKYIQTAEPLNPGPYTGHIPVGLLADYGYSGIMLNHSELRLGLEKIRETVEMAQKNGFKTLVCAEGLEKIKELIPFGPDFIAYEPPELIGGDISVSSAKPEIIAEAAGLLDGTRSKLIVGAGIKNRNDVLTSKKLGAEGTLVASGVVKSKEPIRVVREMMSEVV